MTTLGAVDTAGYGSRAPWWRGRMQYLLPAAGVIFTLLLILGPLATLIEFSFRSGVMFQPGPFTVTNYTRAYGTVATYQMFANTVFMALIGTGISVGLAVLFAFLIERTDMPMRNVAWGLMIVPLAIPGVLFAVSWTFLLSPRIGLFNIYTREFLSWFGLELGQGPFNIYTLSGMIFLEGLRGVTTTFLLVVGAFRTMDPTLEEAARTAGASSRTTFFRILLPMLTPAILASAIYNFMTHLESLEIPLVIGLPARIFVFPSFIYFSTQRFSPPQYGTAAALGVVFVLVSILLILWYRRVVGRAGKYATVTGKGYRPRVIKLGKWRYPAFGLFVLFFLLIIAAPTFILLWTSFMPTYIPPTTPDVLERLSLRNYYAIFNNAKIWSAVVNTTYLALGVGTLTMVLSLLTAWVAVRSKLPGRGMIDIVAFLPHSLPGVIIGISFIFLFVQPPLSYLQLYGSLTLIILAMTVSYISFGTRTMTSALLQIHGEMEEAGRTSGVPWRSIMRRIVLPLLFPAFASGWIWVASHSLRNFSIPIMLTGRESDVLSVVMWESWDDGKPGETCALGVMLILVLGIFTIGGRTLIARLNPQQE